MIQTIDFRFEILLLLCVLASIISLVIALVLALSSRRRAAKRLLRVLGIAWVGYLCIAFLIAAATPQRVVPMNQDLCWDEMCFAVVNARRLPQLDRGIQPARVNDIFYVVTVRVSSHARGRPQSERGLHALLWSSGHYYEISSKGQSSWEVTHPENSASLTTRVWPGQSFLSDQVFEVRDPTPSPGLVLTNGFGPDYFVIGECPLFHKPTILRLSE